MWCCDYLNGPCSHQCIHLQKPSTREPEVVMYTATHPPLRCTQGICVYVVFKSNRDIVSLRSYCPGQLLMTLWDSFPRMTNREFTRLPLCTAEWETTQQGDDRLLKAYLWSHSGVCLCVREGQSGFWECSQPWVMCLNVWMWGGDLASVHSSIRTMSFSVFIVFNNEIVSNQNTTAKTFYIKDIYIQYTTYPTLSPPTGSGSRPRSGQCCFLHFRSQTWLFRFFSFHYISCFICYRCSGLCVGQHFLLLRAVWCQHCLLQTQLFFPTTSTPFSHWKHPDQLKWPTVCQYSCVTIETIHRLHVGHTALKRVYLLSDSRVRRIIVPTTCCTRLALRAGDLLLHRSFSSIYLKGQREREGYESGTWSEQATQKESWMNFLEAEKK